MSESFFTQPCVCAFELHHIAHLGTEDIAPRRHTYSIFDIGKLDLRNVDSIAVLLSVDHDIVRLGISAFAIEPSAQKRPRVPVCTIVGLCSVGDRAVCVQEMASYGQSVGLSEPDSGHRRQNVFRQVSTAPGLVLRKRWYVSSKYLNSDWGTSFTLKVSSLALGSNLRKEDRGGRSWTAYLTS